MDKQKQIYFNLNNFLISTSYILDFPQKQFYNSSLSYLKRCTYIALKIANELKLSNEEKSDLCSYTLVHNIALRTYGSQSKEYCLKSEELIQNFPFINKQKDILKYQCEYINGSGLFNLRGEDIPLFSQIISFVSTIEKFNSLNKLNIENRKELLIYVKENEDVLFSKSLVESFEKVSSNISFWLDLQNENEMLFFIFSNLEDYTRIIDFEDLLEITKVFYSLQDEQSNLLEIVSKLCDYYAFEHKDKMTLLLASSLCKLGKLTIDKKLLLKKDKLSKSEYEIIKTYPYHTKKALVNIMGFNEIVLWASKIQERVDSSGYPNSYKSNELSFKDRILMLCVIYDALTNKREYRKKYSHNEAINVIRTSFKNTQVDMSIVEDLDTLFS